MMLLACHYQEWKETVARLAGQPAAEYDAKVKEASKLCETVSQPEH